VPIRAERFVCIPFASGERAECLAEGLTLSGLEAACVPRDVDFSLRRMSHAEFT
jgi:hypothetical protein